MSIAPIIWYLRFLHKQIFELKFIMELALWLFASLYKVLEQEITQARRNT